MLSASAAADCLIGREADLERLARALGAHRLVTLVGEGGVGKSSLARAYAKGLEAVVWVALGETENPGEVPARVLEAFGASVLPYLGIAESIAVARGGTSGLLVLDGFEQLLFAGRFVDELLAACPELRILVTSRRPLELRGEKTLRLEGLDSPRDDSLPLGASAAGRLMQACLEQASAAEQAEAAERSEAAERLLTRLCGRLGGNPLAIELAAARLAGEAGRLESEPLGLSDLSDSLGSRPSRHKSLAATLDWSWHLLRAPARVLLGEFGLMTGGISEETVLQVSSLGGAALEGLDELERLGFLRTEWSSEGRIARQLDPIREYAAGLAREPRAEEGLHIRLLGRYRSLVAAAQAEIGRGERGGSCRLLDLEYPNLRHSLAANRALGRIEEAAALASSLEAFWYRKGMLLEARAVIGDCLAAPEGLEPRSRSALRVQLGVFCMESGDCRAAVEALEGIEDAGLEDPRQLLRALSVRAAALETLGAMDDAARAFAEARRVAEGMKDDRALFVVAINASTSAFVRGDMASARAAIDEAARLAEAIGEAYRIGIAKNNLGAQLCWQERYDEGVAAYRSALAHLEGEKDRRMALLCRAGLGYTLCRSGKPVEARRELAQARAGYKEIGQGGTPLAELGMALVEGAEQGLAMQEAFAELAATLELATRSGNWRYVARGLEAGARLLGKRESLGQGLGRDPIAIGPGDLVAEAERIRLRIRAPRSPWEERTLGPHLRRQGKMDREAEAGGPARLAFLQAALELFRDFGAEAAGAAGAGAGATIAGANTAAAADTKAPSGGRG